MAFSVGDITSYGHGAFKVIVVAGLLIVMQILMVGGRFASRKLRKVPIAADDYVLLTATVLTFGLCALALAFPRIAGIATPTALKQVEDLSEGRVLGQSFMAWLILYGLSIALSKCAILLLYVRVFTTSNKAFTVSVYLIGFVVIATGIADTFVAIFQCAPVAYEWDKSIPGGKCIDTIAFARYMTVPNVVTGAIMLIMPLPLAWRLNLTVSARIALTATFMHGIIGFVASCIRLSIFFRTDTSNFTTNTSLIWTIWTINEPANYIIAASLPTLRPIIIRLLPTSFMILSNGSKRPSRKPTTTNNNNNTLLLRRDRATSTQNFPWTATTSSTTQNECWVDIEAGGPHNGAVNGGGGGESEQRLVAMRAPGSEEGKDEVVVETMIEVSSSRAAGGCF